jgi:16S rRNA G966 N2-methylase RsmD
MVARPTTTLLDSATARTIEIKLSELKIKEDYEKAIRPLNQLEYNHLHLSISQQGVQVPIEINENNEILDGHHRVKISKELGLQSIPARIHSFGSDPLAAEKQFIYIINVIRRHITDFTKVELAQSQFMVSARTAAKLKGRVREYLAAKTGVSPATCARALKLIEEGSSEQKQKLRQGSPINKEYEILLKQQKRATLSQRGDANDQLPERIRLLQGDFVEKSQEIAPNSIDLILVDPPYAINELPLYKELGQLAQRVLKDGGSLVTYCNTQAIPAILEYMKDAGLQFNWIIAIKLKSPFGRYWPSKVSIKYKPLLWFVKGQPGNIDFIGDLIDSDTPDKTAHNWEQSMIEADHVISRLTVKNQTVLDCMMGSGTTAIAALNLGRKFIGCEIDEQSFVKAKNRIIKYCRDNKINFQKANQKKKGASN